MSVHPMKGAPYDEDSCAVPSMRTLYRTVITDESASERGSEYVTEANRDEERRGR